MSASGSGLDSYGSGASTTVWGDMGISDFMSSSCNHQQSFHLQKLFFKLVTSQCGFWVFVCLFLAVRNAVASQVNPVLGKAQSCLCVQKLLCITSSGHSVSCITVLLHFCPLKKNNSYSWSTLSSLRAWPQQAMLRSAWTQRNYSCTKQHRA